MATFEVGIYYKLTMQYGIPFFSSCTLACAFNSAFRCLRRNFFNSDDVIDSCYQNKIHIIEYTHVIMNTLANTHLRSSHKPDVSSG